MPAAVWNGVQRERELGSTNASFGRWRSPAQPAPAQLVVADDGTVLFRQLPAAGMVSTTAQGSTRYPGISW